MNNRIAPKKILFIKLGGGGEFEEDCITKSQTLRLGYGQIDHQECLHGNWQFVNDYYLNVEHKTPSTATNHCNQIKQFYEAGADTLWITFYAQKMWWCFSEPTITLLADNTKTRPVIGNWSDADINGKILEMNTISGKLSKVQGYRGTICSVLEQKYAITKINGEQLTVVIDVEVAMHNLNLKLSEVIKHLTWQDFEVLIDLIFRQGGWQRLSERGKVQKTLDLDLFAPVTNERAMVQIKSQSNLAEYKKYLSEFAQHEGYQKYFYIVHSPTEDLLNYKEEGIINLYYVEKITELSIAAGLVDWILKKVS
jgi:hypothetical protein